MTSSSPPSILPLVAPYKGKLITSVLVSVIATALGLVPFILTYVIAISLLNPPVDQANIWKLIIASFAAIVIRWVLLAISGLLSHIVAFNTLYEIRIKLSEKFGKLPLGYFNQNSTGTLKKVMNEDVEYLEITIAHGIPEGIGMITTFLFTTIYLCTVDWRMTLAALSGIPIAVLAQQLMFKDIKPILNGYYSTKDRMNSTIIEYVQGMPVIKAFTQTTESFAKYKNSVREYHEFEEDWAKRSLFPWTLFTISVTANLLVILPLGIWLWHNGSLAIATFILFLLLGLGMNAPLIKLIDSVSIFVQTQEGLKRIFNILNEPSLAESEQTSRPERLTIEFKDVHFSYQEQEVLQGVSLVIPQGSITALVGPSGSGKTTIARLLARFWDVNSGEIYLGGINIKNLKVEDLMSKIAFVFQDVVLFNDTIYENIRMGNPQASQEAIIAAAKAACCHNFIEAMPDGYQTVIGEKGAKLSGGQQQRISIARAILKDAPIVILDEATAFVDPENEAQIQGAISTLIQDKTLLIIAHRLSTITEVDQIVVVNEGRIVGKGKHKELLTTSDLYRQMWEAHVTAQGWTFESEQPISVGGR
ncbi:MAG: ABC transporter ATP-binding protein [Symploca sp. SIO2G7]|nr:ABC transporter ATP-binding protein [Symploca sp. SIO2G7]